MSVSFGNGLVVVTQEWSDFKNTCKTKFLAMQYEDTPPEYVVYAVDGVYVYTATLSKGSSDALDFETNCQHCANKPAVPRAEDGKSYTLPNIFPGEVILAFAGASDSAQTRLHGDLFQLQKVGAGDATMTVRFNDGVFLAGGHIQWTGGSYGSWVTMEVSAPASAVKAPLVENQGNCNLVATGLGFNMIVPAAGNGARDLDVTIPIPATNPETDYAEGYWDHSDPWIGKGTMSAGVPGHAPFNLFDTSMELAHLCRISCLRDSAERDVLVENIRPKWIYPEWNLVVTLHNADANKTLSVAWDLMIARKRSA